MPLTACRLLFALLTLALPLFALAAPAEAACEEYPEIECHLFGQRGCGPFALRFWTDRGGDQHCERLVIEVEAGTVVPSTQEVLCLVQGYGTEMRVSTRNYVAKRGPSHGEVLHLDGDWAQLDFRGQLKDSSHGATLLLEHLGPSDALIVKCRTFSPT